MNNHDPYRPPTGAPGASRTSRLVRWRMTIGEFIVVSAAVGFLAGLLLPSVAAARRTSHNLEPLPPVFNWIEDHGFSFFLTLTVGTPALAALLGCGLRRLVRWSRSLESRSDRTF